jgi:methylthioribose-1-phosphate isomerase
MNVNGQPFRTVWIEPGRPRTVRIIDQRELPHRFVIADLATATQAAAAIRDMAVRGAGCIGATAGYGMWLAACEAADATFDADVARAGAALKATRPTAVNLAWAVDRQLAAMAGEPSPSAKRACALRTAETIADEDAAACGAIGRHGLALLRAIAAHKPAGRPVQVLTHCNAGWLAFVDHGTATAPIYAAQAAGIPVHVWVDETRPRNQGAALTAWELAQQGVPCDLVVDNAGGHLMQHGLVDVVLVGTDRTTAGGDVANKIGTYLKALAAADNSVPFYVALPSASIDWTLADGVAEIPIEERDPDEVRRVRGLDAAGRPAEVLICPPEVRARNYGFDVTPARLVTGLITERGVCRADRAAIAALFPEHGGRG